MATDCRHSIAFAPAQVDRSLHLVVAVERHQRFLVVREVRVFKEQNVELFIDVVLCRHLPCIHF